MGVDDESALASLLVTKKEIPRCKASFVLEYLPFAHQTHSSHPAYECSARRLKDEADKVNMAAEKICLRPDKVFTGTLLHFPVSW